MIPVTADDCLSEVPNRFQLTLVAAYRARKLANGVAPLVPHAPKDKPGMIALREIAAGKVGIEILARKS